MACGCSRVLYYDNIGAELYHLRLTKHAERRPDANGTRPEMGTAYICNRHHTKIANILFY